VKSNVFCPKLVSDFYLFCLKKFSNCTEARLGRVASMRRVAVSLSIAVGLFSGSNALAATAYTVTTLADTTGSCSGASCTTLRAAITAANGSTGNTINFTGLSGTITLTGALPAINQA
jgi:CSLREA domain-containing protein